MVNSLTRLFWFAESDAQDMEKILNEYDVYLDKDELDITYNKVLYTILDNIVRQFYECYEERITDMLWVEDTEEKFYELLNIHTNFLDYSVRFKDDKLQALYEESDYFI